MPSALTLRGFVFNDAGTGDTDATITLYPKNTTSGAITTVATDSASAAVKGRWTATYTPSDTTATTPDVQGTSGSSVFRWKYDDQVVVNSITTENLHFNPTPKADSNPGFHFIFKGTPTAETEVTLPDNSGTD